MVTHSCSSIFHFRVTSRSHPELCGRSSWISQHMTCFSHLLSCWTRPWRCRHVQPPFLHHRSPAPSKLHHPSPLHVDATIPVDDLDLDGSSASMHQEIWKFTGHGDLGHGAWPVSRALTEAGYGELWQEATGGLGEACAINLFFWDFGMVYTNHI